MSNLFKFKKNELYVFYIGILGGLIARGITLFTLGYAIDDYSHMSPMTLSYGLSQGRWGLNILNQILLSLGIQSIYATTTLGFLSILIMAYIGILICRIWNISNNKYLSAYVLLLFITFPYQAEIFTFKIAIAAFGISMLIAFIGLYISNKGLIKILISSLLICISLSIYQIVLSYILPVLLFSILIKFLDKQDINLKDRIKNILNEKLIIYRFLTLIIGIILYFTLNSLILKISNTPIVERGQFINILEKSEIYTRFWDLKNIFIKIYFSNETIFPITLKIILVCFLTITIISITKYLFSYKKIYESLLNITFFYLFVLLLSLCYIFPILVLKNCWPVPRVLAPASLFWSGIFVIFYMKGNTKYTKNIFLIVGSIIIFSYLSINNNIYIDQLRINKQDENKAIRIIQNLENHTNFNRIEYLSIIGGSWTYPKRISTVQGDMNISAYGASWAKLPMINEVSGYDFQKPSLEQNSYASKYCDTSPKWPSIQSIIIVNNLGIICL